MPQITLDARMINNSGIGTYIQKLIPVLSKDYALTLLGKEEILKNFSWSKKVKIIETESKIYSIKEQVELPFRIPSCDLYISPHYNVPLLPIKAKKRLVIIHDVYHLAYYNTLSLSQKLYAKIVINSAAKLSDNIVTVSKFSQSEIIKYTNVNSIKIKVIYFGIDPDQFADITDKAKLNEIKVRYNLPSKFFLFVGNIKPHKNLAGLLQAYELFSKENPEFKLVVVGNKEGLITADDETLKNIDQNESLKNNVLFTGYVNYKDLFPLYQASTALIFPSFYEGFGIPPLEAMITGCPVIASNLASLPEACGNAALYVDPYNAEDIAEKMNLIANKPDLRSDLINKGYENLKNFSYEKFSKEWIDLIGRL